MSKQPSVLVDDNSDMTDREVTNEMVGEFYSDYGPERYCEEIARFYLLFQHGRIDEDSLGIIISMESDKFSSWKKGNADDFFSMYSPSVENIPGWCLEGAKRDIEKAASEKEAQ